MQPLIYDVAVSIDDYISGIDGDISKFAHTGPVVDAYMSRLQTYSCAIMGRATYEFGYQFGLEPDQNPYPHMQTYVVSHKLDLPENRAVTLVRSGLSDLSAHLRRTANGPLYLCGGGQFAIALLQRGEID